MNKTEFLEQLLEDNKNDWMGGSDLDELLASKYAVVIARDEDSWVVGAEDEQDVANIVLSTYYAEYYTEWVENVFSVETGEQVSFGQDIKVTVHIDGYKVEAGA